MHHSKTVTDISRQSPVKEYDAMFCLSALHYFNNERLDKLLPNVNEGLRQNKLLYIFR